MSMKTGAFFGAILLAGAIDLPVAAAGPIFPERSAVVDAVIRCRALPGDKERLRCFDAAVRAFDGAIAARSVVVVDSAKIEQDRRARFGERRRAAELPTLQDQAGNKLESLTSTISQVARSGDGGWIFTLADGSRWQQTDGQGFAVAPRTGDKVVVKRAALGTYKLGVGRQPAVRVRRRP